MNVNTGKLQTFTDEFMASDEFKENGWVEVPKEHADLASQLIAEDESVDFDGDNPLSEWARTVRTRSLGANAPGSNRKERRKNARLAEKSSRKNSKYNK